MWVDMKRFSFLFGTLCIANSLFGQIVKDDDQLNPDEVRALKEWVNSKRQVTIKERGEGKLSMAGEVRTEYQARNEIKNGIKQLGENGAVPGKPTDQWDIEVNVMLDYRTDRAWATIKIEYDNNMGTSTGTFNHLALERALLGGRLVNADSYTIDAELGRRNFGTLFDSRIQFGSFMDGLVFKYDQGFDFLGDFYVHAGPFLINEKRNQYGAVGEVGILNIGGTGLFTKYSLIDWDTKHFDTALQRQLWQFLNSQLILGYVFTPKWLNRSVTMYLAGLTNSAAKRVAVSNYKRANWAWYGGFSIGSLAKKGDWSFDANWQAVAAQAISVADASGIGTNNAENAGFYTVNIDGTGGPNSLANARGQTNYKGISLQFLYMLSENVTLFQNWQQSWTLDKSIGPNVRYRQYELEFIFTF